MRLILFTALLLVAFSCGKADVGNKPDDLIQGGRPVKSSSSKWISKVLEYNPAPGQWINMPAHGTPETAQKLVGPKGLNDPLTELSLGGFGGYVVFQFDHTVLNITGYDFVIKGNAFASGSGGAVVAGRSEPGIVMVSFDENGNGKPDDTWYELAGAEYGKAEVVSDYSLTYFKPAIVDGPADIDWTDGVNNGVMRKLDSHENSFWPGFVGNIQSLTFTGTCIPLRITDNSGTFVLHPVGKGYADNYSEDYPLMVGDDKDTRNSNKFDISNAVDSKGTKVKLVGVDFIKVYTAVNQQAPVLGEVSTEICGAISLSVKK